MNEKRLKIGICICCIIILLLIVLILSVDCREDVSSIVMDMEDLNLSEDIEYYRETYSRDSMVDYYKDVEAQLEFYQNMPDEYEVLSDTSTQGITYNVFIGRWLDEDIMKATYLINYRDLFLYDNNVYIELYNKGTISYEEFKTIIEDVLEKHLESGGSI